MGDKIAVIGTGPGNRLYATEIALKKIREAEVLVGGRRLLKEFAASHQEQYPVTKDLDQIMELISEKSRTKKVAVLVSGDCGIFSLADKLTEKFSEEKLEFYPGISSLQLMFARLKRSWQDACFMSFHKGLPPAVEEIIEGNKMVGLLSGNKYTPSKIAGYLLEKGIPGHKKVAVGINLSYETERMINCTLEELAAANEHAANSVVVIYDE